MANPLSLPIPTRAPSPASNAGAVLAVLLTVLISGLSFGCSSSDDSATQTPPVIPPPPEPVTVLDRARTIGATRFADIAENSELIAMLNGTAPVTIFAPTNAAIDALPPAILADFESASPSAERDAFVARLVAPGEIEASVLGSFGTLSTIGGVLVVDELGGATLVDDAIVDLSDTDADNGIVHLIDEAILPPIGFRDTLVRRGHTRLVELVDASGLLADLESGSYSMFAPSVTALDAIDAAEFANLIDPANQAALADRLRFHMLAGTVRSGEIERSVWVDSVESALVFIGTNTAGRPTLNGATLTNYNARAGNGLLHEIDVFLDVPPTLADALVENDVTAFDTLIFAGGLTQEFEETTPLTIFGPTNDAFTNLPPGVFDMLVDPANAATLREVVRSHAVMEPITSQLIDSGGTFQTLSGSDMVITVESNGDLLIDGVARFVASDVFYRTGILHTIDAVLAVSGL